MGERKGTNKYYPPDYNPRAGGLNRFLGTHALRERARKIHLGIIIVRFEMPFNIWCEGCNNHIGMGVRYNAEKKKVGMYYTTPVYEFNMKCHLCDNHFVIKTDPGNLEYVILSGARRQENRWDPTQNGQVVPETKEVQKRLFDDSMYKLEHGSKDQNTAESEKPRLVKIFNRNELAWSDHYTSNQKLRESFRKRKLAINESTRADERLLKRSSLDIPLLPERDEDIKYASLLSKVPCRNSAENSELLRKSIISSPALPSSNLTVTREQKALKVMTSSRKDLGIVIKRTSSESSIQKCLSDNENMQNPQYEATSTELQDAIPSSSMNKTSEAHNLDEPDAVRNTDTTNETQCTDETSKSQNIVETSQVDSHNEISDTENRNELSDSENMNDSSNSKDESGANTVDTSARSSLSLLEDYGFDSESD